MEQASSAPSELAIRVALAEFAEAVAGGSGEECEAGAGGAGALPNELSRDGKNMLLKSESWALAQYGSAGRAESAISFHTSTAAAPSSSPAVQGTADTDNLRTNLCRPLDKRLYFQRAATYRMSWWFAKPPALSPLVCARYGWCNSGPDMVQCKSCGKFLSFRLTQEDKLGEAGMANVTRKLSERLQTGHADTCAWRDNPSPAFFGTLPPSMDKLLSEFDQRTSTFMPNGKDYRYAKDTAEVLSALGECLIMDEPLVSAVDVATFPTQNKSVLELVNTVSETVPMSLGRLLDSLSDSGEGSQGGRSNAGDDRNTEIRSADDSSDTAAHRYQRNRRAAVRVRVALSLFGWECTETATATGRLSNPKHTMLLCRLCQRKVGLWNVLPAASDSGRRQHAFSPSERAAKRPRISGPSADRNGSFSSSTSETGFGGSSSSSSSSNPGSPNNRTFHVLHEHRWFCPHRCSTSVQQDPPATVSCPGWWATVCAYASRQRGQRSALQDHVSPSKEQMARAGMFLKLLG